MGSIETTRVKDVMMTPVVSVDESTKMDELAKLFNQYDINAAPVVDKTGTCIGIITSHDLVKYESKRPEFQKEFSKGSVYGTATLPAFMGATGIKLPGLHFDEVGFHMSTTLYPASADDLLSKVARNMCRRHIHHVVVLCAAKRPIGFLSSLDVVGLVIDEQVCRSAHCEIPEQEK